MRRLFAAALAAGVFASCGKVPAGPSSDPIPVGREFTLAVGQSTLVDGSALRLTLMAVTDDSRCPTDVQCVWEGDARVSVTVASTDLPRTSYELHTSGRFAQEAAHGLYRVRLVQLHPTPRSGASIPAGEYRARLVVARP